MIKKLRDCSLQKRKYEQEVEQYIRKNGITLILRLYDIVSDSKALDCEKIEKLLGENFPKSPWKSENDIKLQFICLLEQIGFVFSYDKDGNPHLKNEKIYSTIVENHLKLSGRDIVFKLADCCDMTNGKVSYGQMKGVLGTYYPVAPYLKKIDYRVAIILFLLEMQIPFKYDEDYLYFP